MDLLTDLGELRAARAQLPEPIGLVPTMGALHAGHLTLVDRARRCCSSVIVSVFVNPLQFGPHEDFTTYPRSLERDRALLAEHGAGLLFAPTSDAMYPAEPVITVDPGALGVHLEGERRPGHFRGVATVVLKLLHLVQPQAVFLGEKDAQQLAIVRRMVRDFDLPTEIIDCPTIREDDGLALSSRNAKLSADERAAAPNLWRALKVVGAALADGTRDVEALLAQGARGLAPLRLDYLAVVKPDEFVPLSSAPRRARLLVVGAAFAGKTRLIDNIAVTTP